jgi:hypothetical protein
VPSTTNHLSSKPLTMRASAVPADIAGPNSERHASAALPSATAPPPSPADSAEGAVPQPESRGYQDRYRDLHRNEAEGETTVIGQGIEHGTSAPGERQKTALPSRQSIAAGPPAGQADGHL